MIDPVPVNKIYGKLWPGPHQQLVAANTSGLKILEEVDPRKIMPTALNQGQIGSCTANATARAMRFDTIVDGNDCNELSRVWIYHFEKAIENTLGRGDTGAVGHDAFTVAINGIPDESLYPYSEDIAVIEKQPPDIEPRAYFLKKEVHAVPQTVEAFKQVLSNNQTIPFGFTVYENFENQSWWSSGEMPNPEGEVKGGHEVLLCGYLKEYPNHGLVLNSWGSEWSLNGYFLFPWSLLTNPNIASDFRTIVRPV